MISQLYAVEEGVPCKKHPLTTSHWQLSHIPQAGFKLRQWWETACSQCLWQHIRPITITGRLHRDSIKLNLNLNGVDSNMLIYLKKNLKILFYSKFFLHVTICLKGKYFVITAGHDVNFCSHLPIGQVRINFHLPYSNFHLPLKNHI